MSASELAIPYELNALIVAGRWPKDEQEANGQHLRSLVSSERVAQIAPQETTIFLYPPPFHTVREYSRGSEPNFWKSRMAAADEISFDHSVVIGDFGLGSDTAIILDYRHSRDNPLVLRLSWGVGGGADNHWCEIAPTFAKFAELLGLI